MEKKVTAEGKAEKELFDKLMCYKLLFISFLSSSCFLAPPLNTDAHFLAASEASATSCSYFHPARFSLVCLWFLLNTCSFFVAPKSLFTTDSFLNRACFSSLGLGLARLDTEFVASVVNLGTFVSSAASWEIVIDGSQSFLAHGVDVQLAHRDSTSG